jgi:alpha-D-ribose 1-methylphosphonate 5-triphosphate diphosphatase PhnM
MNSFVISNVKIVMPYEVVENGFIYVKKGIIDSIQVTAGQKIHRSCNIIDGRNKWLIPGIIDLCNHSMESEIEPKPGVYMPADIVFFSLENRLISHGVTSVYHSVPITEKANEIFDDIKSKTGTYDFKRLKKAGVIRHNILTDAKWKNKYSLVNAPDIIKKYADPSDKVYKTGKSDLPYIIYSDYMSTSIIYAVFVLAQYHGMNMVDAIRMVSVNPAKVLGIDRKLGSIECGKFADLVLVRDVNHLPFVEKVFINGFKVYEKNTPSSCNPYSEKLVYFKNRM